MTDDDTNTDSAEHPNLPNGWEWGSGNASDSHYTRWFQTTYSRGGDLVGVEDSIGGFDAEVYWDEGGDHHVAIYPITGIRDDGDPETSEYACRRGSYDTEQDALDAVPELIRDLKDEANDSE